MKRVTSLGMLLCGTFIGFLCGAMVTTAYSGQLKFNYDQIIAKVGETTITRSDLAERVMQMDGARNPLGLEVLNKELQQRALIREAARRDGVTVAQEEISDRIKEYYAFAENNMAKSRLDRIPRNVLEENIYHVLLAEKLMQISVTDRDARDFFSKNQATLFTTPEMAHLVCISTSSKTKAQEALNRIKSGERAEDLVELYSTNRGLIESKGDVGWWTRANMSSHMAMEIFDARDGAGLKPGEFTGVIEVQTPNPLKQNEWVSEYCIFTVKEMQAKQVSKYEQCKDAAMFYCRLQKYETQFPLLIKQHASTIGKEWSQVKDLFDPTSQLENAPINPNKFDRPE